MSDYKLIIFPVVFAASLIISSIFMVTSAETPPAPNVRVCVGTLQDCKTSPVYKHKRDYVNIRWEVTNLSQAVGTKCLSQGAWENGERNTSGSVSEPKDLPGTPPGYDTVGRRNYRILCSNAGGSNSDMVTVEVVPDSSSGSLPPSGEPVSILPPPGAVGEGGGAGGGVGGGAGGGGAGGGGAGGGVGAETPITLSFSASPKTVEPRQKFTIKWKAGNGATWCKGTGHSSFKNLHGPRDPWPLSDSFSTSLGTPGKYSFGMICGSDNPKKKNVIRDVTIQVVKPSSPTSPPSGDGTQPSSPPTSGGGGGGGSGSGGGDTQCTDGKDNDGDGKIDGADPGCLDSGGNCKPSDNSEFNLKK